MKNDPNIHLADYRYRVGISKTDAFKERTEYDPKDVEQLDLAVSDFAAMAGSSTGLEAIRDGGDAEDAPSFPSQGGSESLEPGPLPQATPAPPRAGVVLGSVRSSGSRASLASRSMPDEDSYSYNTGTTAIDNSLTVPVALL